ncbi:malate dehydrogenase, NAD-dependent [Coemansia reversa NRRL 1564]|uniref:Malate dehydrogenase n=1 Tax=Coemansia reversa (strain ATCC 12441 / NRRL 1564) TaxID=763665 RepID=A0A2G5BJX3_COERN|nr:malate dehydrogenase, NAD-dependent [Coemansia reversa NRRL 1564]|eukprot:PIA19303.1 malate dehydrogenase, NAD-dependent [Coemansia reversa NRRL 1564]
MVSVAVLGAAGGIGQSLSLLLKLNQSISRLALYDIVAIPGVATDISHINTNSTVEYYIGQARLSAALQDVDIVLIPAGIPRKPGMTRDDLFNINASIIRELVEAVADNCPSALIAIISNPVNFTVPIAAEILKARGVYNPQHLFGVTTLDAVRAARFVRDIRPNMDTSVYIPVVGGHSGNTIVPLLSFAEPQLDLGQEEIEELVHRIQYGGDEVVKAKSGAGSATLSMAYAAARFVKSLIQSFETDLVIVEPALVDLAADPQGARQIKSLGADGLAFFAVPVVLGKMGVKRIELLRGEPSVLERKGIEIAAAALKISIDKGISYVAKTS